MIEYRVSLSNTGRARVDGYEQLLRFGFAGNGNVYALRIELSDEWQGMNVRAHWYDGKKALLGSSLVTDGQIIVPQYVTKAADNGCVVFEGTDGVKTLTSSDVHYRVQDNSLEITNPYAGHFGFWDFTNGDISNIHSAPNLAMGTEDSLLVGIDGVTSGYLTSDGLTLATNSCVRIPIGSQLPTSIEISVDMTIPDAAYADQTLKNKSFLALTRSAANMMEFGTEKWGGSWPALRGPSTVSSAESEVAWRYATDEAGQSLGNSAMWISASTLHQHLRLRIYNDGTGEFAMKPAADTDWHVWTLPTYSGVTDGGVPKKYPAFEQYKPVCDTILIGNRATMDFAVPGLILHSVGIKPI